MCLLNNAIGIIIPHTLHSFLRSYETCKFTGISDVMLFHASVAIYPQCQTMFRKNNDPYADYDTTSMLMIKRLALLHDLCIHIIVEIVECKHGQAPPRPLSAIDKTETDGQCNLHPGNEINMGK